MAAPATDAPKEEEEEDGEGNKMDSSGIESMNLSANAEAEGSSRKVRKKKIFFKSEQIIIEIFVF